MKITLLAAITIAALLGLIGVVRGQQFPNCTEFGTQIPNACCCTNDCCTEAPPTEFENIGNDEYRSTVTGQVVKRTGWSSGGFIKCACDYIDGAWVKHTKANVRCLFVPMPSS